MSDLQTDLAEIFRANLRRRRQRLGLTQTQLAELAGVGQGWIGDLEGGRRKPLLESLAKLAAALQTTPDKLLVPPKKKSQNRPCK